MNTGSHGSSSPPIGVGALAARRIAFRRIALRRIALRRLLALLVCSVFLCAAPRARAQGQAAGKRLFEQCRALLKAGHLDRACAKCEESIHANSYAIGPWLNLARCHELQGMYASATREYQRVLQMEMARADGRTDRAQLVEALIEALVPKLSKLAVVVPTRIEGMRVRCDGVALDSASYGVPFAVDPGEHRVEVTAPGYQTWSSTVTVGANADRQAVTVPVLESDEAPSGVSPVVYVGFGVGGAAAVLGTVTGIMSLSMVSDLEPDCPNDVCPREREDDVDTMKTLAHVSTASFIVAGAGAAAGLVALLGGDSDDDAESGLSVRPVVGPGAVGLRGEF